MLSLLLALALTSQSSAPTAARAIHEQPAARILVVVRASDALPTPIRSMTREVERVWHAASVELQWATKLPAGEPMVDRIITVHVTDNPPDGTPIPPGALGAVPVVAGRMRQVIYVSPSAVKRLMATAHILPSDGLFADLYARTVGRVVAHELGHLLLRSVAHRPTGLMRDSFVARDVVSGDGSRFALRIDDAGALEQLLVASRGAPAPAELTIVGRLPVARQR